MGCEFFTQLGNMAQPDDTLYFLGDLTMSYGQTKEILDQLSNFVKEIVFVFGNHDWESRDIISRHKGVKWCGDLKHMKLNVTEPHATRFFGERRVEELPCVLFHYPMRTWNGSTEGSRHLYGHSHAKARKWRNALDVGIDNAYKVLGAYRPFTADEVMDQIRKINEEVKFK